MRFRDIIGQRKLIEKLLAAVNNGRVPHAQLFWGPEGSEQLALALAYAQYINCQQKVHASQGVDLGGLSSDSCGKCPSCLKFQQVAHPDLHFVYPNNADGSRIKKDSKSLDYIEQWRNMVLENQGVFSLNEWTAAMDIGTKQPIINVRDCRQILQTLSLKPAEANFRVVIIWLIERLEEVTSPILLKTLEEPEPQTVFILVSENPDRILPTILSRTQMVKVPRIENADMEAYLKTRGVSQDEARELALRSRGNLVEVRSLLGNNENLREFQACFAEWMRLCFKVDMPALVAFSDRMKERKGEPLKLFLQNCLNEIQACLLMGNNCARWTTGSEEEQTFRKNFSRFVTPANVRQYYDLFNGAIYQISRNADISTLFTDLSIQLCRVLAAAKQ